MCKNGLLIIRQIPCNSKILINNIIDLCDRLVKKMQKRKRYEEIKDGVKP